LIFASRTLGEHLLRGAIGAAAIAAALSVANGPSALAAIPLALAALVALRGCPMCWTVGLLETVGRRFGASVSARCEGGACSLNLQSSPAERESNHEHFT
jgi:hypothetical protein